MPPERAASVEISLREAQVLVINLHRRFAGVSATMLQLVPHQQSLRPLAVLDRGGLGLPGTLRWSELVRHGWRPPAGQRWRIWHARRAGDLLLGLFLRHVLRQPWRFVYTSPSPRRHGRVWRAIVSRSDAIVAVTDNAAGFLDRHEAVIPHGIDVEAFRPPADKRAAWRESGLCGEFGIGVFGRVRPSKGTHLFVEALCELLPRHPSFTGIICGACLPADADYLGSLHKRVARAGLEERIVFLGDQPVPEIKRWYQRIALCVAPSLSEGYGLTPLEAMASAAACVSSTAGAYATMIQPGINGELAETGNAVALCEAMERVMRDPERMLRMGLAGRDLSVQRFSIHAEARAYDAIYQRLLAD
jgi:mannosyltransferase